VNGPGTDVIPPYWPSFQGFRDYSLELSKHRDVEIVNQGAVNSIDIDLIESR
jgi:hypothetical protein